MHSKQPISSLSFLLALLWRLVENLLFFHELEQLSFDCRDLLLESFGLSAPVVLLPECWPEFSSWCPEREEEWLRLSCLEVLQSLEDLFFLQVLCVKVLGEHFDRLVHRVLQLDALDGVGELHIGTNNGGAPSFFAGAAIFSYATTGG